MKDRQLVRIALVERIHHQGHHRVFLVQQEHTQRTLDQLRVIRVPRVHTLLLTPNRVHRALQDHIPLKLAHLHARWPLLGTLPLGAVQQVNLFAEAPSLVLFILGMRLLLEVHLAPCVLTDWCRHPRLLHAYPVLVTS
jgi:hypothetical protein